MAALRLGRQHDRDDLRIDAFAALDVADAGAVEHVLYTVLDDLAQLGRNRLDVSTRLGPCALFGHRFTVGELE
ncbi:hypothetical protein, partial [Sphingobium sp. DC-2]|uniref:hypothetical protein n=1 Tax=Sphingobium sp. DC-2 TaxID=1303256 RepID=UPI001ED9C560